MLITGEQNMSNVFVGKEHMIAWQEPGRSRMGTTGRYGQIRIFPAKTFRKIRVRTMCGRVSE